MPVAPKTTRIGFEDIVLVMYEVRMDCWLGKWDGLLRGCNEKGRDAYLSAMMMLDNVIEAMMYLLLRNELKKPGRKKVIRGLRRASRASRSGNAVFPATKVDPHARSSRPCQVHDAQPSLPGVGACEKFSRHSVDLRTLERPGSVAISEATFASESRRTKTKVFTGYEDLPQRKPRLARSR